MDKIIPSLIQGSPTAVVVAIVYFLFVQPMSTRLDKVVDVMNREVIPIVNELKKKPLPGPEIKPLVELIENQRAKTEQVHRLVADALERQEVSQEDLKKKLNGIQARLDENKKLALSAAVSPNFSKDPRKTFSKGEVVS